MRLYLTPKNNYYTIYEDIKNHYVFIEGLTEFKTKWFKNKYFDNNFRRAFTSHNQPSYLLHSFTTYENFSFSDKDYIQKQLTDIIKELDSRPHVRTHKEDLKNELHEALAFGGRHLFLQSNDTNELYKVPIDSIFMYYTHSKPMMIKQLKDTKILIQPNLTQNKVNIYSLLELYHLRNITPVNMGIQHIYHPKDLIYSFNYQLTDKTLDYIYNYITEETLQEVDIKIPKLQKINENYNLSSHSNLLLQFNNNKTMTITYDEFQSFINYRPIQIEYNLELSKL